MATTYVQKNIGGTNGSGTVSVTLVFNVTNGNTLVAIVRDTNNEVVTGAISNDGTPFTWTLHYEVTVAGSREFAIFTAPITNTQACTVTFNPAAATGRLGLGVYEMAGQGAYGTVNATAAGSGTVIASASFTPSAAAGVAFAGVTSSQTVTWESDFNAQPQQDTTGRLSTAFDLAPPASAQAADATQSSGAWTIGVAWFADAVGGGGSSILRQMLQHHRSRTKSMVGWRRHDSGLYLRAG